MRDRRGGEGHLWRARFFSDAEIGDRFVGFDGVPREVIAVAPRCFRFPSARTLVLPAARAERAANAENV
jgi:hypothetical protein